MVKKHRSLRNNLGFVRGIIGTTVRLSIGWGLQPRPLAPDRDFAARSLDYWRRHTGRQSFDVTWQDNERSIQRLVLKEAITDGELFGIKILDQFGKPQRQLIKTEMIGDPPGRDPKARWEDGILLNTMRRPLEYSVLQYTDPANPTRKRLAEAVRPRDMLHVYDRERATQNRGLPWGYTGLNHGVDVIDIAAFEKVAHKLNTAIVGAVTTPTGQVPYNMQALTEAAAEASAAGETRTTRESVKYLDIHGTQVPIFKTGESMSLFLQGRSSINTMEFAGWLCAQYAHGFGIPVEVIVGMIQGSAAVRGNLELAGRFFEEVQMLMIDDWCQPNWENIIGTGILASLYPKDWPGVEPLAPPIGKTWEGWSAVEWRGPKNITVDRGRDGKLHLDLVRSGLMTHEEYWTMIDEDPDEMDAKIIRETHGRLQQWLAAGLPEDKFWIMHFGQAAQGSQPAQPQPPPAE
jgi:capsid protein